MRTPSEERPDPGAQLEAVGETRPAPSFEAILARWAARLADLSPERLDEGLVSAFGDVGRFLGADRCFIVGTVGGPLSRRPRFTRARCA